jgi:hypothetical protein
MMVENLSLLAGCVAAEIQGSYSDLDRRPQPGRNPLHRVGFADNLIDVIAIDAPKRADIKSKPSGLYVREDHWTSAPGTDVGRNRDAAWVEQDCQG